MYNEKYSKFSSPYLVYIRSRCWRLLPLYWIVLAFSISLYFLIPEISNRVLPILSKNGAPEIMGSNLLLLGLANSVYLFIGSAWSLDIELQFYIIAPIFVIFINQKNAIYGTVLFAILSIFAILYIKNVGIIVYLPWFMIGYLIYLYNYISTIKTATYCLAIFGLILTLHYVIPSIRDQYLLNRQATFFIFNYREFLNVILALLTIPFITLNIRIPLARHSKDQLYSSMSYVIYLIHWPLLQVYALTVIGLNKSQKLSHLIVYYVVCFAISWLISKYLDPLFENKRKLWLKKESLKR